MKKFLFFSGLFTLITFLWLAIMLTKQIFDIYRGFYSLKILRSVVIYSFFLGLTGNLFQEIVKELKDRKAEEVFD